MDKFISMAMEYTSMIINKVGEHRVRKSGLIRWVAFLEGNNLVAFHSVHLVKSGLIRAVAFGGHGSGLISEGLLYTTLVQIDSLAQEKYTWHNISDTFSHFCIYDPYNVFPNH